MKLLPAFATVAVLGLLAASPALAQTSVVDRADRDDVTCRNYTTPVTLSTDPSVRAEIYGELCSTSAERRSGTTVQLLIHGATYNHNYWDFGTVDGVRYSYARDVAERGIATFAIDELGSGDSTRPASTDLTIQAVADVTHQIVQGLRSGSISGTRFGKVISVGHSLGSVVVWQEAIANADVDGVIVTGAAHSLSNAFGAAAQTDFYPASKDPKFAGSSLDPGYLTT